MPDSEKNLVIQNPQSTVVAEYTPSKTRAEHYQSEDALEKEFIAQLESQCYKYVNIKSEKDLIDNLRTQLENLNNYHFSDPEWDYFFKSELTNSNQSIEEKTQTIQKDHIKILTLEDGTTKNIRLIDKDDIHNNSLQVINQYATDSWVRSNRYDVTILVNGLPLVHVELKRRWIAIQEAFNQINRYWRESFWADSWLFEYIQIFVISNGTQTKYYSNTTRFSHIKEQNNKKTVSKWKKSSNSFEFTSWWSDKNNKQIRDLVDFSKTFFAKHSLLNVLTKYCVFTYEKQLLVLRPYQIVATESIIRKISISHQYKKYWSIEAWGYIWHTTGSGKTLTSFKTAQIASNLDHIQKVLFIVDRKDLDYQTMKEYDAFQKWAANSNKSTAILRKQLEDPKAKIIITTIQKLDSFIKKYSGHGIFDGEIVLIFDECHRSQFGDMHKAITDSFKKYYLFGFTGTPIFPKNASSSWQFDLRTTQQAFWDQLHTYTIVNAISDKNVLPFKVDYIQTIKEAENIENTQIEDIDRKKALESPKRIRNIVQYIRQNFDRKTKRNTFYTVKDRRLAWFNSIFAVSSIEMARLYYKEFQKQLSDLPSDQQLKVTTIFSFAANPEESDGTIDENPENTSDLSKTDRDFLEEVIIDYNTMFWTSYDTSSEQFQSFYKDVSNRVKSREVDILIVVNMFLTGFDATTLNTLWVDKNLKSHGLLQAFSRTNRILNSVKRFGNIVCFRNLEKATNEAISLFWDKEAWGVVLIKTFREYYDWYEEDWRHIDWYKELVARLTDEYPLWEQILWENAEKSFIKLYSWILRLKNVLTTFDEFIWKEILSHREFQDYHSMYIDLYNEFRKWSENQKENINDDLVFEMELIKQVEINIDYILELIIKYHNSNTKDKELLITINKAINSSIDLRNKKDLIQQFIESLTVSSKVGDDWIDFVEKKKEQELDEIINSENLNKEETYSFVDNAFRDGYVSKTGTGITKILPPISAFSPDWQRSKKKKTVIEKLTQFFDRFFDISEKVV